MGDSVRGSLRDLVLDRLGRIDYAILSEGFFREELPDLLVALPEFQRYFENASPAILVTGSAIHGDSKLRASGVQIHGIDERFVNLFPFSSSKLRDEVLASLSNESDEIFPSVVINETLQHELRAMPGDQILMSFESSHEINREAVLGNRDPDETVKTIRLVVRNVLPDRSMGRFGLRPNQNLPANAYVFLPVIQEALEKTDQINSIFVTGKNANHSSLTSQLQNQVAKSWRLEDIGLFLRSQNGSFSLESKEIFLKDAIVKAAAVAAKHHEISTQPVLTYLANRITANQKAIPYSTVTAVQLPVPNQLGKMNVMSGSIENLKENEIVLNSWAAKDLQASIGDRVDLSYYVIGPANDLITAHSTFILKGIISMEGLALDRMLTPDFPGIQNVKHISDWSPPFPIDLSLIRDKDEEYWDEYGASPKAFISEEAGRKLWSRRFGEFTSIRFAPRSGSDPQQSMQVLGQTLLQALSPERTGFAFQAVKAEGLKAAAGSTDFGLLFLGFSLFLIVSASLMVSLLYRLGVEERGGEIGVLLSMGFPQRKVLHQLLGEAAVLAAVGSLIGLAVSLLYASFLLGGLRSWWIAAIGSPFLNLHVNPLTLVIGYLLSFGIMVLSVHRSVRRVAGVPLPLLFGKLPGAFDRVKPARVSKLIAVIAGILAILLTVYSLARQDSVSPVVFFAVGALLLIAGLAFFSAWLKAAGNKSSGRRDSVTIYRMAARNNVRHPARSLLSVALVCCACFVIIAVGANRKDVSGDNVSVNSGTGGFALMAESDVPVIQDLNSEQGRLSLGIEPGLFRDSQVINFRLLPGDDASCLNLYRPQQPRILGVPQAQIDRGGFEFRSTAETTDAEKTNPWRLLAKKIEEDVIPAIGDYNSVQWILHSGLGEDITIKDERGAPLRLRLVGLLNSSIFQSELLISEENFKKHFPSRAGYSYFLIQTPVQNAAGMAGVLESSLVNVGFDAVGTSERLASYLAVENTYLSTFQTLGAFGLLLGTCGLGIILIRNILERKGELATLRAFGFPKSRIAFLVLAENSFLLFSGILIGLLSATIAVLPQILENPNQLPWFSLFVTLAAVVACGTIAGAAASSAVLRIPLLPALKAE